VSSRGTKFNLLKAKALPINPRLFTLKPLN